MIAVLAQLVLAVLVLALVVAVVWGGWVAIRSLTGRPGPTALPALPARQRAELAAAIEKARWVPAHDEVDGVTRVLVRRAYVGLDGRPEVLDERVLETFSAQDPAWEARFTEAMSRARFRCTYLNAEDSA